MSEQYQSDEALQLMNELRVYFQDRVWSFDDVNKDVMEGTLVLTIRYLEKHGYLNLS